MNAIQYNKKKLHGLSQQANYTQYNTMYKLIDVIAFLLQSSFRNPIEFCYIWIVSLCISCNVTENV
jgi:hypothetical protein